MSDLNAAFNIYNPYQSLKKTNEICDGILRGIYVNLIIELYKYDTDKYYYIDPFNQQRKELILNMKDNGKIINNYTLELFR
jgi:hypothetical protein